MPWPHRPKTYGTRCWTRKSAMYAAPLVMAHSVAEPGCDKGSNSGRTLTGARGPGSIDSMRRAGPAPRSESSFASGALARGHLALARGAWKPARAAFERSLRIEETAEALEGLGIAAWWLNDGATMFDARERAYRTYRQRGDRLGAGRIATALASDHFHFRGEPAVARGWYRRADRLLDGLAPLPEHGWLRVWQGD